MKNKKAFMISIVVMIVALICMGINIFILAFPDVVIRVIGVIMLIDLFTLGYSMVKLKNITN